MIGVPPPQSVCTETIVVTEQDPSGLWIFQPTPTSHTFRVGGPMLYVWKNTFVAENGAFLTVAPINDSTTASKIFPAVFLCGGEVRGAGGNGGIGAGPGGGGGGGGAGKPGGAGGPGVGTGAPGEDGGPVTGGAGGAPGSGGASTPKGAGEDGRPALTLGFLTPTQRPDRLYLSNFGTIWGGGGGGEGGDVNGLGFDGGVAGSPGDGVIGGEAGFSISNAVGVELVILEGGTSPNLLGPIEDA